MVLSSVVLPAPLGPTSATFSPACSRKDASSSSTRWPRSIRRWATSSTGTGYWHGAACRSHVARGTPSASGPRHPVRHRDTLASAGGCNKFVESFGWSLPVEGLAWASVEEGGDVVEVVLSVDGQVGAFGEELTDEAVPVLVGAALPG